MMYKVVYCFLKKGPSMIRGGMRSILIRNETELKIPRYSRVMDRKDSTMLF